MKKILDELFKKYNPTSRESWTKFHDEFLKTQTGKYLQNKYGYATLRGSAYYTTDMWYDFKNKKININFTDNLKGGDLRDLYLYKKSNPTFKYVGSVCEIFARNDEYCGSNTEYIFYYGGMYISLDNFELSDIEENIREKIRKNKFTPKPKKWGNIIIYI